MDQLIEAFITLKESYELETGTALSQMPRHYESNPQPNLTQLYPYPEKEDGEQSTTPAVTATGAMPSATVPIQGLHGMDASNEPEPEPDYRFDDEEPTQSPQSQLNSERNIHVNRGKDKSLYHVIEEEEDVTDFLDTDLDTMSLSQAEVLAEKMLLCMSMDIDTPHYIKQEDESHTAPTLVLEEANLSQMSHYQPSLERSIIICPTFMSKAKKDQVEKAAKALKSVITDELSTRPTHVVMDISALDDRARGSGRTMKHLMAIVCAAWVLRLEWVTDSLTAGFWLKEDDYQIPNNEFGNSGPKRARARMLRGEPPLFHGFEFQLFGPFQCMAKEGLEKLIRAGGGLVVAKIFRLEARSGRAGRTDGGSGNSQHLRRHLLVHDALAQGMMHQRKLRSEEEELRVQAASVGARMEVVHAQTLLDATYQFDTSILVDVSTVN
ncbi:hypothetical protein BGZ94_009964 [Podila epigama]|nr:hypothetical protein BGZ94_009964 [Podila epigama]